MSQKFKPLIYFEVAVTIASIKLLHPPEEGLLSTLFLGKSNQVEEKTASNNSKGNKSSKFLMNQPATPIPSPPTTTTSSFITTTTNTATTATTITTTTTGKEEGSGSGHERRWTSTKTTTTTTATTTH